MEKLNPTEIKNLRVIHVNRASVTFYCETNGERYMATKKLANQILSGLYPELYPELYLIQREYNGNVITWLATLSIFV